MRSTYGSVFPRKATGHYYFKVNGRFVKLTPLTEGRDKAELMRSEYIRRDMLSSPDAEADLRAWYVNDLVEAYLAAKAETVKAHTLANYRAVLKRFGIHFSQFKVNALTVSEVKYWIEGHDTWGVAGRHHAAKYIRLLFDHFVNLEKLPRNPMRRLVYPEGDCRPDEALFRPGEYMAIYTASPPWLADLLWLLHGTGARPGELCYLQRDEVDCDNMIITKVKHKTSKKGKTRKIVLTKDQAEFLEPRLSDTDSQYVFAGPRNGVLHPSWVNSQFQAAGRRAGLPAERLGHLSLYSFRHSYIVSHLSANPPTPLPVLCGLVGHSSPKMIEKHYGHFGHLAQQYRDAAAAVQAHRQA